MNFTHVTISEENADLVREIDDYGGDAITVVLSRAVYDACLGQQPSKWRLTRETSALFKAYDALREADVGVRVLAPNGDELLSPVA